MRPQKLTKLLTYWLKSEFGIDTRHSAWPASDVIWMGPQGNSDYIIIRTYQKPKVILYPRPKRSLDIILLHPEVKGFLDKITKFYGLVKLNG